MADQLLAQGAGDAETPHTISEPTPGTNSGDVNNIQATIPEEAKKTNETVEVITAVPAAETTIPNNTKKNDESAQVVALTPAAAVVAEAAVPEETKKNNETVCSLAVVAAAPVAEATIPEEAKKPEESAQVAAAAPAAEIAEVKVSETEASALLKAETDAETVGDVNANVETNGKVQEPFQEDWQKRESELLKKIEELEQVKNQRSVDGLKLELKVREEEIDLLKAKVRNLETELQAALSKPSGKNHEIIENIKQQHEELLSKARGMIFDKTKMVKNQELQIEALTTQVQSLKDINVITKDLLEIRNSEVKAMEDRFQAMEARYKAEKDRYSLVLERAQTSTTINDDLRKEYETQLAIFKELREKYEQRVQALVAENARLKELKEYKDSLKGGPSG